MTGLTEELARFRESSDRLAGRVLRSTRLLAALTAVLLLRTVILICLTVVLVQRTVASPTTTSPSPSHQSIDFSREPNCAIYACAFPRECIHFSLGAAGGLLRAPTSRPSLLIRS